MGSGSTVSGSTGSSVCTPTSEGSPRIDRAPSGDIIPALTSAVTSAADGFCGGAKPDASTKMRVCDQSEIGHCFDASNHNEITAVFTRSRIHCERAAASAASCSCVTSPIFRLNPSAAPAPKNASVDESATFTMCRSAASHISTSFGSSWRPIFNGLTFSIYSASMSMIDGDT